MQNSVSTGVSAACPARFRCRRGHHLGACSPWGHVVPNPGFRCHNKNTRSHKDVKDLLRFSIAKCEERCGAPRYKHKDSQRCQRHVAVFECKMRGAVRGTAIKTQGFTTMPKACCGFRMQNASCGAGHRDKNTRIHKNVTGMLRFSNAKCEVRCGAPRCKHKDSQRRDRHVAVFDCKMRAAVRGTAKKPRGFTTMPKACCGFRMQNASCGAGHLDKNTRIHNDAKGMLWFSNAKCELRCGAPR
jgi:hypothetical protein